jgi:hypothetical protein
MRRPLLATAMLAALMVAAPVRSDGAPPAVSYSTVIASDGVPLAVTEWGNPQGPPVLLLHGFSLSSAVWRGQQDPALAPAGDAAHLAACHFPDEA